MPDRLRGSVKGSSSDGAEGNEDEEQMGRIAFAMHEMCQPLMALQCRLEIGKMVGTSDGYAEAVHEALTECDRLLVSVEVLRAEVLRGMRGCPS